MPTSSLPQILIIGGGYAGILAACRLAGKARGLAHITLVNRDAHFIERVRLHQTLSGQTIRQYSIEGLLRGTGVDFVQGVVTELDTALQAASVQTAHGTQTLRYDKLIYAAGSKLDLDRVPGVREHAFSLMPEHSMDLQAALQAGKRLVIIGGGLTGIETSTELAEAYPQVQVTLMTRDSFAGRLSRAARQYLGEVMSTLNITIAECQEVARVDKDAVVTATGERFPYDVCIWTGAFTVPSLARTSGLAVNEGGQMLVDEYLRSISHPDIYGVGDATYVPGIRMACATALPLAAFAADNIAAELRSKPLDPFRFVYVLQCISLGRKRGLIQMVNADDSPKETIYTGRLGAFIKEMVVRYPLWSLQTERRIPGFYLRTGGLA